MTFNKVSFMTLFMNLSIIAVAAIVSYFAELEGIPAFGILILFFLIPNLLLRFTFWTEEQDTKSLQEFFGYDLVKQFFAFMVFFFIPFLALLMYMDYFLDLHFLRFIQYAFTLLLSPLLFVIVRYLMKARLKGRTMFRKGFKRKKK